MLINQIIFLICSVLVLAIGAETVVKTTAGLAKRFGIPSYGIGFLLLGITTSTPEVFVALQSIWNKTPELSVGNLVGGSIILLSLILGVCSLFLGDLKLKKTLTFQEIILASLVTCSPVLVLLDGKLTKLEGGILVSLYLFYLIFLEKEERLLEHVEKHARHVHHLGKLIFFLILGFIGIFLSSHVIVTSAQVIIREYHISSYIFGLIILTLGTNLPELALVIDAIKNQRRDIAIGDLLGSSAVNTCVIGLIGLFSPFQSNSGEMRVSLLLLLFIVFYFLKAIKSGAKLTRWEGGALFLLYIAFFAYSVISGL